MLASNYMSYTKVELITMILKFEELKEYYVKNKIDLDIKINEQRAEINKLQNEIELLKKLQQKERCQVDQV